MPSTLTPITKRTFEFLSLSALRTRTLRSNFIWNAVGMGVFSLSQLGILVVFAKLGSVTLVGELVYGLSLAAPLFVIAGLQLRSIQATDATNRHTIGQYLGLRALTTVAAIVVAALAAAVVWATGNLSPLVVLLWALSKAVDSGSDAIYGLFQQYERMDYVGCSLILRGLMAIASVAALFRASHSAPLALAGMVAAWIGVFVLFEIPAARILVRQRERSGHASGEAAKTLRLTLDRRQLMPLCLEAAPLGVVAFLLTIQVQIPRYVVIGLLHTRELGLFSAAAYLTFVGTMLVNALGAPACVRLAQYHVAGAYPAFRQPVDETASDGHGAWRRRNLSFCLRREPYSGIALYQRVLADGRSLDHVVRGQCSSLCRVFSRLCHDGPATLPDTGADLRQRCRRSPCLVATG